MAGPWIVLAFIIESPLRNGGGSPLQCSAPGAPTRSAKRGGVVCQPGRES